MITICCVLWGEKYPSYYVENLRKMVASHTTMEHRFVCLTDRELSGIETLAFKTDKFNFPGWWQKIILFQEIKGPFIYIDLDSLITGSIDFLERYTEFDISMPKVFTQGKNGFQGSVICSNGKFKQPFDEFNPSMFNSGTSKSAPYGSYGKEKIRGDQEYLSIFYESKITPIESGIYSYKIHCQDKLPNDGAIICFHGKPDYHEIQSGWVRDFIKENSYIQTK